MSTWKIVLTGIASFALTALFAALLLPYLRKRKAGQSIREDGPQAHLSKSGTPTMGGIAFIFSVVIVSVIFNGISSAKNLFMLLGFLSFGAIGFADDYIKVVKKRNLGLTALQKIFLQFAAALILSIWASKDGTEVFVPFIRTNITLKWFYIPFEVFVFLAMSNAVNLTDGLDGLASGVTAAAALCFAFIGRLTGNTEMAVFTAALSGACLGFLIYNRHPAKLFMGDTGSMALGGALAACAVSSGFELLLPIIGGVYAAEALSVIIQVVVFKTQNGRRFFRMAPLHHHFELGGIPEEKVAGRFVLATLILCAVALAGTL